MSGSAHGQRCSRQEGKVTFGTHIKIMGGLVWLKGDGDGGGGVQNEGSGVERRV